jgi:hypothetical protein
MSRDPGYDGSAPVAAIEHDGRSDVDALLQAFVAQQRSFAGVNRRLGQVHD